MKHYKLIWPHGGWAIVKNWKFSGIDVGEGTFLCGSRRGTKDTGKSFTFNNFIEVKEISEQELKELIEKNFVKLL